MLEIRNLVKVYKTKGGAEVRALDGVSVKFEEKGMVFLLGKSGSGKSTLLNLCGGLDSPDAGEIIIKGRSSKDFSQSDFDSYRNTFVGFVFQEYNILNEFSVEDNIALALELQGKNKNKEQVHSILAQVDLENFAKRKPNTLSGGQKQRVAIARALVKNPEIIMADEPTGALDSNTGKQVFDTLKKLSREKLVIVVSHDREFAEIYGDRIIELKDGKIISDVTKTKIAAVDASENISFIGNDTISVRSGAKLTESDIQKIQDFLLSSDEDVIISNGQKEISDFKKAARIDENGARESFKDTDETAYIQKRYSADESKFIRSKLPARHALRIGASSLKIKPFRLIFTILLSLISFTLFGLFSTLTFYNETETAVTTYSTSGYDTLSLRKYFQYSTVQYEDGKETSRWKDHDNTLFSASDLAQYREKYGESALGVFYYSNYRQTYDVENANAADSVYYSTALQGFAAVSPSSQEWRNKLLTDTDLSALADEDIVISSFTFESLKSAGLKDAEGNPVTLNGYQDAVGKTLLISRGNDIALRIAGVYRCDPPAKFDSLKDKTFSQADRVLSGKWEQELDYGIYRTPLVSHSFYEANVKSFGAPSSSSTEYLFFSPRDSLIIYEGDDADSSLLYNSVYYFSFLPEQQGVAVPDITYFDRRTENKLSDGEVAVPFSFIREYVLRMIEHKYQRMTEEATCQADPGLLQQAEAFRQAYAQYAAILADGAYWGSSESGEPVTQVNATEAECMEARTKISALIDEYKNDADLALPSEIKLASESSRQSYGSFRLTGFVYGKSSVSLRNTLILSENDCTSLYYTINKSPITYQAKLTKYVKPADSIYNTIVIDFPASETALRNLLQGENKMDTQTDSFYLLESPVSERLHTINDTIGILEKVFLWVGIVMAVFAMLLLFNFISVSITNKKKEIGILRAVGARSTDVFKIFYSESAIITAICFVLAMVASFVICDILNRQLAGTLGAAIFVFGPLSWLVLLGIAVVTSFIATFLPVYGIAKKKPVESIRAL